MCAGWMVACMHLRGNASCAVSSLNGSTGRRLPIAPARLCLCQVDLQEVDPPVDLQQMGGVAPTPLPNPSAIQCYGPVET